MHNCYIYYVYTCLYRNLETNDIKILPEELFNLPKLKYL